MNQGMTKDTLIFAIRSRQEYCAGHLAGAVLIETPLPPLESWQKQALWTNLVQITKHLDRDQAIAVYCKKGIRAGLAKRFLNELGYWNVIYLGGIETEPIRSSKIKLQVC